MKSRAATSVLGFGVYLLGLGATLIVAPNPFLALFGLPAIEDVWIRALGMAFLFLGAYHILAARHGYIPFFQWSVYLRASVILFFSAFVFSGLVEPVLVLFGAIDLTGAAWTWLALRADARAAAFAPPP